MDDEDLEDEPYTPPYGIVKASEGLGFKNPLDQRWEMIDSHTQCGRCKLLIRHECYTFTYATSKVEYYRLWQCPQCRTVYWRQVNDPRQA